MKVLSRTDSGYESEQILSWKEEMGQCQHNTVRLWVQHKEAPEGASFLSIFLQEKIVVNCLKYLV